MHQEPEYLAYFSRCQHPSVIYNKYTASRVTVNCGYCHSCLLRKSTMATRRCEAQASQSRYVYFVTLSYSSQYVPTARIDRCLDVCTDIEDMLTLNLNDYQVSIVPRSPFVHRDKRRCINFNDDSSFRYQFSADSSDIDYLRVKTDLTAGGKYPMMKDYIPYLNYGDFSSFYKRLRTILHSRIGTYEKISSYVVGEYGPKTLRPHFHFLLFFNEERVASYLRSSIRAAWPFGRIDVQRARGAAASYCAGYVNNFACLPSLYQQIPLFRPFGRFSVKFALSFFESYFTRTEKSFSFFQKGIPLQRDGALSMLSCPRSIVRTFYPRFTNDDNASSEEVFRIIRSISESFNLEGRDGIMSEFFLLRHARYLFQKIYDIKSSNSSMPDFLRVICEESRLSEYLPFFVDEGVYAIYRLLLKYRNFLKYWIPSTVPPSSSLFHKHCIDAIDLIRKFYLDSNYQSLKNQLTYESYYFDDHPFDDFDFVSFISDNYTTQELRASLSKNELCLSANERNSFIFYNRIKHKKLNDVNNIFNY